MLTQHIYRRGAHALWNSVCCCRFFICQRGHPESPVLKSDCVCVHSFSVLSATTGVLCFTGHYIVWHMGFICSVQETRPSGLRMEPLGLMPFPSSPLVFIDSREKLGYWSGTANGVIGLSAGSPFNFWVSSREQFAGGRLNQCNACSHSVSTNNSAKMWHLVFVLWMSLTSDFNRFVI